LVTLGLGVLGLLLQTGLRRQIARKG